MMQEESDIIKILREEEQLGKLCNQWLTAYHQLILPEEPTEKQSNDTPSSSHQPFTYLTTNLQEIYQIVFENSAVAIMLTNEKEQIISWNKYAENLLGMQKNDLHLKSVESLYPTDEWKKIRAENVRQKGMQHHLETKMMKKDNTLLDVDISLSVLKNREGHIVGSIGVIKDISKQKQVERELKQSEEKFKILYEKAPIPYHTLSPIGKITDVSDKWCQILEYAKEEILGRSIFELIAEDERDTAKISFKEKIQSKQAYTGGHERSFVTKKGEKHIFVINDFFSFDECGNVSSVHTTMEDITRRKEIEKKLKTSEKRFRDISYSMADWIWEVDAQGNYTFASGKVEDVIGYTAQELLGKTLFDLMNAEEADRVGQIFKKSVAEKKPIIDLEKWNVTKNGTLVCTQTTGVPILDDDGQLVGYRGVDKNITERKRAEESLRLTNHELTMLKDELSTLNQDLERKIQERTKEVVMLLKQKDEFISQLGHDLKTPLSVILNVLPMIKEEIQDKALQKDCEIAMRNSNYISSLVTETLKIAELSSSNITFNTEPLVLLDVVQNVVADKQLTFDKRNIIFINKLKDDLVVYADKLRIEEVITNIITNALKYTPAGGTITVDATEENNEATICVTDTGVGISREEINRIFDEFYKVDKSRHEIDTCGLGLSICKRIVEKHGGKIWAKSPGVGKGTSLCFTLKCGTCVRKSN